MALETPSTLNLNKGHFMADETILEVKNLKTYFYTDDGIVKGADDVSFSIDRGETLALVGESGSGKSVSAMSILKLIPQPPGKIEGGEILFNGEDLVVANEAKMRKIRGNEISIIFQEPMTSLNPLLKISKQIAEPLILHQNMSKKEAKARSIELLELVGISDPESRLKQYPYEMSGGIKQRVMIAMALACKPALLIADEPTTALDVTIQAQVLTLIEDMQKRLNMSILMITHDLGVVAETADKVAVMYCGEIVEYGTVDDIFHDSKHPYLIALKKSIPHLDSDVEELFVIEGLIPDTRLEIPGCKFAERCPSVMDRCRKSRPSVTNFSNGHYAKCFLYQEESN